MRISLFTIHSLLLALILGATVSCKAEKEEEKEAKKVSSADSDEDDDNDDDDEDDDDDKDSDDDDEDDDDEDKDDDEKKIDFSKFESFESTDPKDDGGRVRSVTFKDDDTCEAKSLSKTYKISDEDFCKKQLDIIADEIEDITFVKGSECKDEDKLTIYKIKANGVEGYSYYSSLTTSIDCDYPKLVLSAAATLNSIGNSIALETVK